VLLEKLNADPEAPWRDYGPHGLTARKLGLLLAEYEIRSGNIRFDGLGQAKGFRRIDFADAWDRYCPHGISAVNPQPAGGVSVPPVPRSLPQVNAGRLEFPGRMTRPDETTRTRLTSTNEGGTDGTATPAQSALRLVGGTE
jgi:hypothetical protein